MSARKILKTALEEILLMTRLAENQIKESEERIALLKARVYEGEKEAAGLREAIDKL